MTSGAYRTADGRAQITWELKDGDCGPVFSATGDYDGESGQNLDSIGAAYPGDSTIQAIVAVWRHYHLNGMCAGTVEQESFLKELREGLAASFVERDAEIDALLLGLVSQEHVLFISGIPGLAKSAVVRRMTGMIDGGVAVTSTTPRICRRGVNMPDGCKMAPKRRTNDVR